jgi:two-component system, cell cycle response regulator
MKAKQRCGREVKKISIKVLIVDDNHLNIRLLKDILEDENYIVESVDSGLQVLNAVHEFKPDIILLDIMMPCMDGFEVCKELKQDPDSRNIPIIMVTAKTDGSDIKRALELGAFDYIRKPLDDMEVVARVQSALRYKAQEERLKEIAMKDSLTGIYNHALLIDLLGKELAKAHRRNTGISFVMLDIDYFKKVNDTYGHLSGDIILKELTKILVNSVREGDIVGRYGGEEFSIVFPEISKEDTFTICERIRHKVETHGFDIGSKSINITVSLGFYFTSSEQNLTHREVVQLADEALYEAKRSGRNRVKSR